MKKTILAAIVGGLILFIWQFLSWSALNLHVTNMSYTPAQNEILDVLASENVAEGSYFLPTVPKGTSAEDYEKFFSNQIGKPWAQLSYHKSFDNNMGMNMFRGFLIDFLSVFFLCYILMANANNNFKHTLISSVLVGLIGYFTISYLDSIWFSTNSVPALIDTIVQWGLVGLWLGWFLNRNKE